MSAVWRSFLQMLRLIRRDRMLLAAGAAPLLAGVALRCGVPAAEEVLVRCTGTALSPYYGLFDILLASLTPAMFCFIAAMVMLEERDDHIDRYLFATACGRNGYYISRIVLPALAAFSVTALLLPVFHLSALLAGAVLCLSLTGALQGVIVALLVVALSANKLEGMAVTKLSSLIILGAVVPWFVPAPLCFGLFFLPSFWMGKAMLESRLTYFLPSFAAAVGWIAALWRRIQRGCRFLDRKSDLENSKIPIDPDAASSCILCPCSDMRKHKEVLR